MQVRTPILGHDDYPTAPDVIDATVELSRSGRLGVVANRQVWPALLSRLDRIDPSFRN